MTDDPEVTPRDALEVAQRALGRVNDVEAENDALRQDLDELEYQVTKNTLRTKEYTDDRDYKDLVREDKIGILLEYAYSSAVDGRGRTFDYTDIKWEVFDGGPSAAHCYDLMEECARTQGFEHRTPATGNEHLYVDPGEAERGIAFYSAKKDLGEGGRS